MPVQFDQPLQLVDGNIDIPGDFYLTSEGSQIFTFPYGHEWIVRQGSIGNYQQLYTISDTGAMTIATRSISNITIDAGTALTMYADEIVLDAGLDDDGVQSPISLRQDGTTQFEITSSGTAESTVQVSRLGPAGHGGFLCTEICAM